MRTTPPTLLTFNWHEPYIALLSQTDFPFAVAEPNRGRLGPRRWDLSGRDIPANVELVTEEEALSQLAAGAYSAVICHNVYDLAKVAPFGVPAAIIFHNKLTCELALGGNTVTRRRYLDDVAPLIEQATLKIFVSHGKQADWGIDGEVIEPGIDVDAMPSYTGERPTILRVGNHVKERAVMFAPDLQEAITEGLPSLLVGHNQTGHGPAKSHRELRSLYANCRLYLSMLQEPYEDGYNLSLLEAMASGQPALTWRNRSGVVDDGVNGAVATSVAEARAVALRWLNDTHEAEAIGLAGKEMVASRFPLRRFVERWREVIGQLTRYGQAISFCTQRA